MISEPAFPLALTRANREPPSQIHSHLWPSLLSTTLILKGASTIFNNSRSFFSSFAPPVAGQALKRVGWRAIVTGVYPFWSAAVPSVGAADTVAWGMFAAGVTTCMAASALFHASINHSKKVSGGVDRGR